LTHPHRKDRRRLLTLALVPPLSLLGCGNAGDDTHVKAGDATKAEAKARAEMYKAKAVSKKQGTPKR
jgi:hypothetical protein